MNESQGTAMARPSATAETALGTSSEFSQELAPTAAAEAAKQEVQAAVILAKRFPRNEDEAYAKIVKACKRPTFAADVEYSFPRGGKPVVGPSVYLAREFARAWGNIRHGCDIVADAEEERTIRAWAWDMETNVKVTADATFKKLIYRKAGGWQKPDERDMRELTNRHAALAKRNCLLELLPSDMVEDACNTARATLKDQAAKDPDAARKSLITAFAELNVPIVGLEKYLGHPLAECSPEELANLRTIYKSIKDGNSAWADYLNGNGHDDLAEKTKENAAKLKERLTKEPDITPDPSIFERPAEDGEGLDSETENFRALLEEKLGEVSASYKKDLLKGRKVGELTKDEIDELLEVMEKAD